MQPNERPDWAPEWWWVSDRHHTLGSALSILSRREFHWPGTLAAGLRRAADYLDYATARDGYANPWDRVPDEIVVPDWALEDRHWTWLDDGKWSVKQLRVMSRRLSLILLARRELLRKRYPDGRPM